MLNGSEVSKLILDWEGLGREAEVGYDLSVKSIKKLVCTKNINGITMDGTILYVDNYKEVKENEDFFVLLPGTYSVTFDQGIVIPDNIVIFIHQRSSLLRMGGFSPHSVYDPGYETENIGTMIMITKKIVIQKHSRICQAVGYHCTTTTRYNGQFQGIKDIK